MEYIDDDSAYFAAIAWCENHGFDGIEWTIDIIDGTKVAKRRGVTYGPTFTGTDMGYRPYKRK